MIKENQDMEKMVAYCGIVCSDCEALIATKNGDMKLKRELAEKWSKEFNSEIKPEDINCDGCLAVDGNHISYCYDCCIRKCGMEKGIENCGYCDKLDCESLNKFHEMAPEAKTKIDDIRKSR